MFFSKSFFGFSVIALSACASSSSEPTSITALKIGSFKSGADGFATNSYWVEGQNGIAVFDTQFLPDIAESLLKEIRKSSQKPILYAVNLHANPDKFNGNEVFVREGAELITNAASRAAMPAVDAGKRAYWTTMDAYASRYPTIVPFPEKGVFAGAREIELGGVTINLHELKNVGVSERQTVAVVETKGERVVIVGDLVHTKTHAWEEHGTPSAWIRALDEVLAIAPSGLVLPGRGEPEKFNTNAGALRDQQRYLKSYIAAMKATKSLASQRDARVKAVTSKLVSEFPDYAMADFINYSMPQDIK